MHKKLYIKTYGCQMNVYDSLKMQELLAPFGFEPTELLDEADMVILNTCHIREKASEKVYSELGRIKKVKDKRLEAGHSAMIIAVAGCVGQAEGEEIFRRTPYVDIVVGPQSYHTLPDLIAKLARSEKHLIELDFIEEDKFDNLPQDYQGQGASAFVSIQEGCDKFCTFCVVPYTRGAEFSRPVEQIYRESMAVVAKGAKEVHLLGQNVNAYHGKANNDQTYSLADLIKHVATITGLERIRYTTSHPRDMNDELIALHGQEQKLMPFLHLPIQSGSNKILKAMNRKHTREEYFTIIDKLRVARPDIVMSSDFIIGFPGETDEDFADTLDLVKRIRFGQCFSFKYSPRPGTPAAAMEQVPEEVKVERLATLQQELAKQQFEQNVASVGKVMPVLFEKDGKFEGHIVGKTPYMQSVYMEDVGKSLIGKIVDVKITKALATSVTGEIL
ncbi:MAG: tRNA (N6-isopentenyl adenosine(37)-C2)-methylthiotransferase MiaB [Rickettsiaceae bacterium]